jgi:hypothetical protein
LQGQRNWALKHWNFRDLIASRAELQTHREFLLMEAPNSLISTISWLQLKVEAIFLSEATQNTIALLAIFLCSMSMC